MNSKNVNMLVLVMILSLCRYLISIIINKYVHLNLIYNKFTNKNKNNFYSKI